MQSGTLERIPKKSQREPYMKNKSIVGKIVSVIAERAKVLEQWGVDYITTDKLLLSE